MRTLNQQIDGYRELDSFLANYCAIEVLKFDEKAALQFQTLQKQRIRIGTMDLKIAAIALAHDATLLTRNLTAVCSCVRPSVRQTSVCRWLAQGPLPGAGDKLKFVGRFAPVALICKPL